MDASELPEQIDISKMHRTHELTVREETPGEQASRLRIKEANARLARQITWALCLSLMGVALICFGLIMGSASEKTVEWARSILTAVVSGSVFYVTGQKAGKKSDD